MLQKLKKIFSEHESSTKMTYISVHTYETLNFIFGIFFFFEIFSRQPFTHTS